MYSVLLMDTETDKNNEKAYEVLKSINDENEKIFTQILKSSQG